MINAPAMRRFVITLLLSASMIGIGFVALSVALHGKEQAEIDYRRAYDERAAIASRLSRAQQDEPEIRRALAQYEALRKRGVIGPERRLEWAEALTRERAQRKLSQLDFELAPQHVLSTATPELPLRASTMTLRAQLWHEGDLLRLLADLRGIRSATVLPRRCTLDRGTDAAADGTAVSAVCELDWITLGIPSPHKP